jgi:ferredoxin-NADP reductase
LVSLDEEQSIVPKHCYSIPFREVAALTETLKELAADSKLESKVEFVHGSNDSSNLAYRKATKHVRRQMRTHARAHHVEQGDEELGQIVLG